MQPDVSTFEDDPMQFILRKYEGLNKTLTYLMTPSFQDYITGIYIVAPKPTTFKIVLHNGQFFFLQFTGKTYEATVAGKGYYLMNIGEKERCMLAIARLLRYGNPLKTKGPEGAEQGTREEGGEESTGGEGEEGGGILGGGGEEAGGEEETIAESRILEEVLKKTLAEYNKKPYDNLSDKAKKVADEIITSLNIPKEEIKSDTKDRIVILTDIPRNEVFAGLENLGYKRVNKDVVKSSSSGYVTSDGVQIIHKEKTLGSVGGAGIANEKLFVNNINEAIKSLPDGANLKINQEKGNPLIIKNVVEVKSIGKEGEKQGLKGDAKIYHGKKGDLQTNVSIKKDGDFRWASVMTELKDFYIQFLTAAAKGKIKDLQLKKDPKNPTVLQMWNPKTKSSYGRVYITNHPSIIGKENLEKLAFGPDDAIIVQRSFSDSDFKIEGNDIIVQSTKIIKDISELEELDYPVLEFERNASKASKTSGLTSRGIVLRVSPIRRLKNPKSKANSLVLDYNNIKGLL